MNASMNARAAVAPPEAAPSDVDAPLQPDVVTRLSLRSRGIFLSDPRSCCTVSSCRGCLTAVGDVGVALGEVLLLQNWYTILSCAATFFAFLFFKYTEGAKFASDVLDFAAFGFLIVLPSLLVLGLVYLRRQKALDLLGQVKADLSALAVAHAEWPVGPPSDAAARSFEDASERLVDNLKKYLSHRRPYVAHGRARHLASPNPDPGVVASVRVGAALLQQALRDVRSLAGVGAGLREHGVQDAQLAAVAEWSRSLHASIQGLSAVKEFGTPRLLASLLRLLVVGVVPLLAAPFWAAHSKEQSSMLLGLLSALTVNVVLVSLLNLAVRLADPFEAGMLDAICMTEQSDQMAWILGHHDALAPADSKAPGVQKMQAMGSVEIDIEAAR